MQARSIAAWRNVADGMFEQDIEHIPINDRSRWVSHSPGPGGCDNARGGLLHRRGLPRMAKRKIVRHKDERYDLAALIAPG
jgi:hypothetical protein